MATFISLVTYTDQGIKAIKDAPKRVDGVRLLAKKLGGELGELYLTMAATTSSPFPSFPTPRRRPNSP